MIAPNAHRAKFLNTLFLTGYCAWIYWLSAHSSLKPPIDFGILYQDKLYHAGAYFIMSVLAYRSFKHFIACSDVLIIVSIVFCSIYGITDEWHQSFVIGRSSDVIDWFADSVGASLAMVFLHSPIRFKKAEKIAQS
ncbi:VanZ family protein [Crenothrix polyspora]|uniref:VanZ family protein n=1 Tax=Crenothrix polyspora TaxID=360316 RepID=A0A1R4GZ40_9GAMM|nr:VanZ family protein [Crenothrix polyspora]SJM89222.1 VanZ family protein [Crenothrix polyspora]